ncbi:tannase/feruloyl esterase family alpha/beta hydrolase [Microvirga sp. VF16]|uniref:tannase/feruloyl esterase family alpha/beta hydrolase n=1 Tax=Microvirga sp. VF16 TaxID=2807101 RepID=UPI00193CBB5E|nr:tannase/feruloyl esterase family alpha/beta hydrolase [Microvirga sp. VF16]QRM35755.1 tannase/feruloyl esterase family alpha/beta hydrolase [Microvirga sp. VF16]
MRHKTTRPHSVHRKGGAATLSLLGISFLATSAAAEPCEDLKVLSLANTTLEAVEPVAAGAYTPPGTTSPISNLPAFYRVRGVTSPVPGSKIGFEVWLPQTGWNGKLQMFGNGGYSSAIPYSDLGALLRTGYATVGTDTGHTGDDPDFAIGKPESIIDWGHRAVHESVTKAKVITSVFYGRPARYSYFSGCSTGGQQAFMEAQRYPDDFDGIIAGAPGHNRTHLNAGFLWQFIQNHPPQNNESQIIPSSKLALIAKSALAACRKQNGAEAGGLATDEYLNDPFSCDFDPAAIQCKSGDGSDCLTASQVDALKKMYAGARNPRTGKQIYFGWPVGSENSGLANPKLPGWSLYWADPKNAAVPSRLNFWQHWAFDNPNWNWWDFDFDRDMEAVDARLAPVINAMDPDLEQFRRRGGKLIHYHGLADPVVPALDSVSYHGRVLEHQAQRLEEQPGSTQVARQTGDFYRLFLAPGLEHCRGGPGANVLKVQEALENWVERGVAPDQVVATRSVNNAEAQGVAFSRPLCPYPQKARYDGKGKPDDAASFICVADGPRRNLPNPAPEYLR